MNQTAEIIDQLAKHHEIIVSTVVSTNSQKGMVCIWRQTLQIGTSWGIAL